MLIFYVPTLSSQLRLVRTDGREVVETPENVLKPSLSTEGSVTMTIKQNNDTTFDCRLKTEGSFLSNVQLDAKENDFHGISFKDVVSSPVTQDDEEPKETLIMSGECSAETKNHFSEADPNKSPVALKIATVWGVVTAMVTEITPPLPPPVTAAAMLGAPPQG